MSFHSPRSSRASTFRPPRVQTNVDILSSPLNSHMSRLRISASRLSMSVPATVKTRSSSANLAAKPLPSIFFPMRSVFVSTGSVLSICRSIFTRKSGLSSPYFDGSSAFSVSNATADSRLTPSSSLSTLSESAGAAAGDVIRHSSSAPFSTTTLPLGRVMSSFLTASLLMSLTRLLRRSR